MKTSLFLLRVGLGCLFLYAGISKLMDPAWSAAGYLNNASTFPGFYHWFASPQNIGWGNLLNEWGLTLIWAASILGVLVRWASIGGILMMLLYYFPVLQFPYVPSGHAFIVDDHIIYIFVLAVLAKYEAGKIWGLDMFVGKKESMVPTPSSAATPTGL